MSEIVIVPEKGGKHKIKREKYYNIYHIYQIYIYQYLSNTMDFKAI